MKLIFRANGYEWYTESKIIEVDLDDSLADTVRDQLPGGPTQWAYDQACKALHARPTLADLDAVRRECEEAWRQRNAAGEAAEAIARDRDEWRRRAEASELRREPDCICGKDHGPGPRAVESGPGIAAMRTPDTGHWVDPLDLLADDER